MSDITRERIEDLMERCHIGVGGRHALDDAHDIMADCYGTLGAMMIEIERMRGWIEISCVCPCCQEMRVCLDDCSFNDDLPSLADRMAEARAARFGGSE